MKTLPTELQAARLKLVSTRPYLSSILFSFIPVENEAVKTMAVDKYHRLYWSPDVLKKWTVDNLVAVLEHEAWHLLNLHFERALSVIGEHPDGVNKFRWNCAADLEINDGLVKDGLQLPEGALLPKQFGLPDGQLAEHYFDNIPEPLVTRVVSRANSGGADPTGGVGGSSATGQRATWEPDDGGGKEARDDNGQTIPTVSPLEAAAIRKSVAEAIMEARQRGTVPSRYVRWAEQQLSYHVDWRKHLPAAIRTAINSWSESRDWTYRKQSRRQLSAVDKCIILPGVQYYSPNVCVVIDTSGSMSDQFLGEIVGQVGSVLKTVATRSVTVLAVDSAVHTCQRVTSAKDIKLVGGGGTNMRVGIDEALRLKPRPDVIIVLTDGQTPWGDDPPPVPVVIGIIGNYSDAPPPWARVVYIK